MGNDGELDWRTPGPPRLSDASAFVVQAKSGLLVPKPIVGAVEESRSEVSVAVPSIGPSDELVFEESDIEWCRLEADNPEYVYTNRGMPFLMRPPGRRLVVKLRPAARIR